MKKKKRTGSPTKKKVSSTRLMFLSVILLLIVFEALYILKDHHLSTKNTSEVAGVSSFK